MSDECIPTHYGPQDDQVPLARNLFFVEFNGTTAVIDCGSDASLDDLPDVGSFTVDFWVYYEGAGKGIGVVACKFGNCPL